MATFEICPNAESDLETLAADDPQVAAEILFILQEMASNPELRDRLLEKKWRENEYDIEQWWKAKKLGREIFRLKVWLPPERLDGKDDPIYKRLSNYRILYALVPASQHVRVPYSIVLACVHRKHFDYGDNLDNVIAQRILRDLDTLF